MYNNRSSYRRPGGDALVTSENLPHSTSPTHTGCSSHNAPPPLCPLLHRKIRGPNKKLIGTITLEAANNTYLYIFSDGKVTDGKSPQRPLSAGAWCLLTSPGRSLGAEQHDVASSSRYPGPWLCQSSTLLSTTKRQKRMERRKRTGETSFRRCAVCRGAKKTMTPMPPLTLYGLCHASP